VQEKIFGRHLRAKRNQGRDEESATATKQKPPVAKNEELRTRFRSVPKQKTENELHPPNAKTYLSIESQIRFSQIINATVLSFLLDYLNEKLVHDTLSIL
jgi:hypothetical protein